MGATKDRMKKACPTLRDLADKLDATITLLNELRTDHNANVADVTAKLNLEIARTENIATKFTAHLAATHPDTTNVLMTTAVAAIATDANLATSPAVETL